MFFSLKITFVEVYSLLEKISKRFDFLYANKVRRENKGSY